ncbi:MAG: autotransporter outer membrane beta-barrel domain-containing protein, partial [Phycisphaeraceae bacterium]
EKIREIPADNLAAIREYKNDSRQVDSALVIAPGTPFLSATDPPDRNYILAGLGLTAALNGGSQLFIDFESRQRDTLFKAWSLSVGLLMEL